MIGQREHDALLQRGGSGGRFHLLHSGSVHRWRIRVPVVFVARIGSAHFGVSLRTAALAEARSKARCWTAVEE